MAKTVVLPTKPQIQWVNEPLFTPVQEENRRKWQELTAMGISAAEFQTAEIRLWMADSSLRVYGKATNVHAVASWISKQGVLVFGQACPANLRSQVVHADGKVDFVVAANEAMTNGGRLRIAYDGRIRGERTEREITPLRWGSLGLVAYCHLRNEERTFVPERVAEFEVVIKS